MKHADLMQVGSRVGGWVGGWVRGGVGVGGNSAVTGEVLELCQPCCSHSL